MRRFQSLMIWCVSVTLGMTPASPAFADGQPGACHDELVKRCQAHRESIASGAGAAAQPSTAPNVNRDATRAGAALGAGATALNASANACASQQKECEKVCGRTGTPQERQQKVKTCREAVIAAATITNNGAQELQRQSQGMNDVAGATRGGGEGMNPMATGALGALAGGLLGYMMGKKDGKDQMKDKMQQQLGALQPGGVLDCSKDDAHQYSECNDQLMQICSSTLDAAKCVAFSNRFCGTGPSGGGQSGAFASPAPDVLPANGGISTATYGTAGYQPQPGRSGEGIGSQYCKNVLAHNFCKQGGRAQCPSCLQIAKNQAPACQANPALCLAQNSPEELAKAKQTCPTDPAFADPSFMAGGGSQIPGQLRNEPLPNPIVPGQSDGLANNTGAGAGTTTGGTTGSGTANTGSAMAGGGSTSGGSGAGATGTASSSGTAAVRDAYGAGVNSGGSGGGGSATSSSGISIAYQSVNERGPAGSGGSEAMPGSYRPASAGPASDVQGEFGPSLFAMGTQVIRSRCQAGKLLNCP